MPPTSSAVARQPHLHLKKSLDNRAMHAVDQLLALVKSRFERIQ